MFSFLHFQYTSYIICRGFRVNIRSIAKISDNPWYLMMAVPQSIDPLQ